MNDLKKSAQRLNNLAKSSLSQKNKTTRPKYFRILDSSKLPQISRYSYNTSRNSSSYSPQHLVEQTIKRDQYVYIDMNEQNGYRIMKHFSQKPSNTEKKSINSYNDDQEQKYGNNHVGDLNNLSEGNKQMNEYLHKTKQLNEQRESIRTLFKSQIDNFLKKNNTRKKYRYDYESLKPKKKEYNPDRLRKYLENQQLQTINQQIWKREVKLMNKFGIDDKYQSYQADHPKIQQIIKKRKYRGQGKLPQLSYSTIQ